MTLAQACVRLNEPDDDALLARFQDGDDAAFSAIYERYRGPVTGYAWRMLGRREEAEEVCTDTFCRIVEGRYRRVGGTVRGYVFTVAHRLCIDRIRRRGSRTRALLRLVTFAEVTPVDDSPENAALHDERTAAVERAIAELPEAHRATTLLYYGQELPSREVARVLGCTDQQVRSRLAYARKRLRVLLADEEAIC